jgi:hypothetical protein
LTHCEVWGIFIGCADAVSPFITLYSFVLNPQQEYSAQQGIEFPVDIAKKPGALCLHSTDAKAPSLS